MVMATATKGKPKAPGKKGRMILSCLDNRCLGCSRLFHTEKGPAVFEEEKAHVAECWFATEPGEGVQEVFFFMLRGDYLCWEQALEVWLAMPVSSTFEDLDNMIQDMWMEPCCSHLTKFWIDTRLNNPRMVACAYGSDVCIQQGTQAEIDVLMSDIGASRDHGLSWSTKLEKFCKDKEFCMLYQYDSGTTTDAIVKYAGRKLIKPHPFHTCITFCDDYYKGWLILRNVKPRFTCYMCDKGARYVDMGGDPAKASAFFCSEKCWVSKWGKKHDRELLYRLGNSPRTGACGYPADTPHPDFSDESDNDSGEEKSGSGTRKRKAPQD